MNQHEDVNRPEDMNGPEGWNESGESFAELEQYLTQALRRVDAPAGFAERTLARTQPSAPVRAKVIPMAHRGRLWAGGAIAAVMLAGVFLSQQVHIRHEREQAELAQAQFESGMRITDHALEHTREQLQRAGVRFGN